MKFTLTALFLIFSLTFSFQNSFAQAPSGDSPDILGITLNMTTNQAIEELQNKFDVKIEHAEINLGTNLYHRNLTLGYTCALSPKGEKNGNKDFVSFFIDPDDNNKIIAIKRECIYPRGHQLLIGETLKALNDKYGNPHLNRDLKKQDSTLVSVWLLSVKNASQVSSQHGGGYQINWDKYRPYAEANEAVSFYLTSFGNLIQRQEFKNKLWAKFGTVLTCKFSFYDDYEHVSKLEFMLVDYAKFLPDLTNFWDGFESEIKKADQNKHQEELKRKPLL